MSTARTNKLLAIWDQGRLGSPYAGVFVSATQIGVGGKLRKIGKFLEGLVPRRQIQILIPLQDLKPVFCPTFQGSAGIEHVIQLTIIYHGPG